MSASEDAVSSVARQRPEANPVLVEVTRGALVESRHRGAVAVVDWSGRLVAGWGAIDEAVYPRSAVKPLQALAVLETGAFERFGLGDAELALACASHSGEPQHTELVEAWLGRIGLGIDDLECGVHPPSHAATAEALIRAGRRPSAIHNNCSGKHTAMLTASRHRGEPTRFYLAADHPAQRRWIALIGAMCGVDPALTSAAIDGCGIPTLAIPLRALAHGMARLARPEGLPPARAEACKRVRRALAARPELVEGTGRFGTAVMAAVGGGVLLKGGAEGVMCAALPERGLGVALKIDDGAGRAAEVAIAALLRHLGALDAEACRRLGPVLAPTLRNWSGTTIGEVRAAAGWLGRQA